MIAPGDSEQLLTFLLAGDDYAVGIRHVEEVVSCGIITRVPAVPAFIRGAMNLRGQPIAVIDLALKLGFPETALTRWTCLLLVRAVINGEPTSLGVLIDAARQLIECTVEDIKPPPPLGTRVHPEYLRGLVSVGDRFVPMLDIQRLLSAEELLLVEAVTEGPSEPPAGPMADLNRKP